MREGRVGEDSGRVIKRRGEYFCSTAFARPSSPLSVFDMPNVLSRSLEKLRARVDLGRLLGFQSSLSAEAIAYAR